MIDYIKDKDELAICITGNESIHFYSRDAEEWDCEKNERPYLILTYEYEQQQITINGYNTLILLGVVIGTGIILIKKKIIKSI